MQPCSDVCLLAYQFSWVQFPACRDRAAFLNEFVWRQSWMEMYVWVIRCDFIIIRGTWSEGFLSVLLRWRGKNKKFEAFFKNFYFFSPSNDVFPFSGTIRHACKVMLQKTKKIPVEYHGVSLCLLCLVPMLKCCLSFLPSSQPLTHVKRMMDVVPVHICVSSITTALRPAPVRTLWSFHPTNNPALVSQSARHIFVRVSCLLWVHTV